jgi:D-3-phosphoglycerate dehydrogenase
VPGRVLIAEPMSPRAAEVMGTAGLRVDHRPGLRGQDLSEIIAPYDGLVVRSGTLVTRDLLLRAPKLRVIGRAGVGTDNIDIPSAHDHGVVVMNTPTGNSIAAAEHAIAMLMALLRHIPQANASMRAGRWERPKFKGSQITGKTVGIIGMGNIGRIVSDRMRGLRAVVLAYDPYLSTDDAQTLGVRKVELDDLMEQSHFITVHSPLLPATHHLLNDTTLALCRPGATIINCARGGIIDEAALLRALDDGHIAGAALDVFEREPLHPDHPLRAHPSVILTPHLGASTFEAQETVAEQIAQQIADFLLFGRVINAVA